MTQLFITSLMFMLVYKRLTSSLKATIFISPLESHTIASNTLFSDPKYRIGLIEITLQRILILIRDYETS